MLKKELISIQEYYQNYQLISRYDYSKKFILGKNQDKCYFCNINKRTNINNKFKQYSHAIPKFLNSNLYNYDECDECNKFFSIHYENKFATHVHPIHSLINQNFKFKQNGSSFYNINGDIYIDPSYIKHINFENLMITFEFNAPSIDYLDIYITLLKMGLSLIGRDKRKYFSESFKLLFKDFNLQMQIRNKNHFILFGMNDEFSTKKSVSIYKSKSNNNIPEYIFFLQYNRFFYQIYFPFLNDDAIFNLTPIVVFKNDTKESHHTSRKYEINYINEIKPKRKENFALVSSDKVKFDNYIRINKL